MAPHHHNTNAANGQTNSTNSEAETVIVTVNNFSASLPLQEIMAVRGFPPLLSGDRVILRIERKGAPAARALAMTANKDSEKVRELEQRVLRLEAELEESKKRESPDWLETDSDGYERVQCASQ